VTQAQAMIRQRVPGGGTTLTLALVLGERVFTAHVGDSRLYILGRDNALRVFTKDHSLVKRLVDLGEITEADAAEHPQRNVLYRALVLKSILADESLSLDRKACALVDAANEAGGPDNISVVLVKRIA